MKASIRARLEQFAERHEEITALLSDSDVISDNDKFRKLSREHAELGDIVGQRRTVCGLSDFGLRASLNFECFAQLQHARHSNANYRRVRRCSFQRRHGRPGA